MFLITVVKFLLDCLSEHSLALAVDKYNLTTMVGEVGIHDFTESVDLIVEDVRCRHASGVVKQLVDVEIHLK